ncbi:MAG: hypothetical protein U1E73_12490 [Planctomycetota bacterium]
MSHPTTAVLALLLTATAPLVAQERFPRFAADLGFGLGEMRHNTSGTNQDDDTGAAMFRLRFEGYSRQGFGGGVRIEGNASRSDLFENTTFDEQRANTGSLFAHFTYRADARGFAMPVRIGFLLQDYGLEDQVTDDRLDAVTIGPQFEIAPEFYFARRRDFAVSLVTTLTIGAGPTWVHSDLTDDDYASSTVFYGFEIGPRVHVGMVDFAVSYLFRGHSMDDSDTENSTFVRGYDSSFSGILFTFGFAH